METKATSSQSEAELTPFSFKRLGAIFFLLRVLLAHALLCLGNGEPLGDGKSFIFSSIFYQLQTAGLIKARRIDFLFLCTSEQHGSTTRG